MKAIKNDVEVAGELSDLHFCVFFVFVYFFFWLFCLSGFKNSHIKDAAALCCFFAWLEKEIEAGHRVTEISAANKLASFRQEQKDFVGLSFDTISSSGPNGAIIHYKPTEETDRVVNDQEVYLCDSGGQYRDGTTDVTRTLHFGTPTLFQRQCFTRVLKGQINLATCIFPSQVKVCQFLTSFCFNWMFKKKIIF